ncbi:hypothetical protein ACFST9_12575 [Hymenobacter monticola]|uniref:DUF7868 domain-containing protein n=1 Tax=Hymenobacter monticola TaxID=1705399 RepID=A0ABY4BB49_9BACT|nr:hypothetical protein [Hymenobacter monticola]UOE34978.1 hypothetical protein MTP16_04835 [Hymenobacter monticola]
MNAATPTTDPNLLGASAAPLVIRSEGSSAVVKLLAGGQRRLTALLAAGQKPGDRVYLVLEHIRGRHDAAVLNVYLGSSAASAQLLAGSRALFGLRMASLSPGQDEKQGAGLNVSIDVTQVLFDVLGTAPLGAEISVSIVPSRPLPEAASLVVERISLHYMKAD